MKQYTAPALTTNGQVVRETLGGTKGAPETGGVFKPLIMGDVGFYL
jgi:hypothetical protein